MAKTFLKLSLIIFISSFLFARAWAEEKKPFLSDFRDDLIIPSDLLATKAEKLNQSQEYLQDWQKKKVRLQQQSGRQLNSVDASGAGFGQASGAGFFDTSLYLAGDIAVGVFFAPGNCGNWPPVEINNAFNTLCAALNKFPLEEPNARIRWDFVKEVDNDTGIPNPTPPEQTMRQYVNDLRNTHNTHWAYAIVLYYGTGASSADIFGPSVAINYKSLTNIFDFTVRHETLHIFGAVDQYQLAPNSPISRAGYLYVVNANSEYNDGNGYFNGAGEGAADIMNLRSDSVIGVYTRGQIGWRDADGDGLLDPVDTYPHTVLELKTGDNPYTFSGIAKDMPLLNEHQLYALGDVTINKISKVEYRVNGGDWVEAIPVDGAFDQASERFSFTTVQLKAGFYTIEARAINSVGNVENSYAVENILVPVSTIPPKKSLATKNGPEAGLLPPAFFTAVPESRHGNSLLQPFRFDARNSYTASSQPSGLRFRWDFNNDGVWDTDYTQDYAIDHAYAMPTSGATNLVASYDTAGTAYDVFVDGNTAYVADGEAGLEIMDISIPSCPVLLGNYNTPGYCEDVTIAGNLALVADGPWGLQIIDISNPRAPVFLRVVDTPGDARGVAVLGSLAYVADGPSGLQIIDIANPRAPVIIGSYNTAGFAGKITVIGSTAFIADGYAGLQIIDISNPRAPALIGNFDTPGIANGLSVVGTIAYVADYQNGVQIIDISTPQTPRFISNFQAGADIRGISVAGTTAYIANDKLGFKVVDFSNPSLPVVLRTFDTPDCAYNLAVRDNYVLVADGAAGMMIVSVELIDRILPVSSHWKARLEVLDTSSNVSQTTRDVWAVAYNHPPSIARVDILPGPAPAVSAVAYDQDSNTRWDGLLEYRWDINNDGVWETRFSDASELVLPSVFQKNRGILCEVKDRFHGTDNFLLHPPILTLTSGDSVINAGQTINVNLSASDIDSTFLMINCLSLPSGANFIDNQNGTAFFRWTPVNSQAGSYALSFRASDGLLEDNQTIFITVLADTTPASGTITINRGAAFTNTPWVTLNLTTDDQSGSGVTRMRFCEWGKTVWSDWELYQESRAWLLRPAWGYRRVMAQFKDAAGNKSKKIISAYIYLNKDLTPPAKPVITNFKITGKQFFASWASDELESVINKSRIDIIDANTQRLIYSKFVYIEPVLRGVFSIQDTCNKLISGRAYKLRVVTWNYSSVCSKASYSAPIVAQKKLKNI